MDVRNCRKCGRIFNYVMGPIMCPACVEAQEAKFQTVKTYIRENPGVGVPEVARECDVETSQIYQWLREERLQLVVVLYLHDLVTLSEETVAGSVFLLAVIRRVKVFLKNSV